MYNLFIIVFSFSSSNDCRVRIKRIAIAKCDLFFHYRDAKETSFYYFRDTKICAKHEKTHEFHLYCWDHFCKVNYLIHCFHREFRVSTEIMVRDYCMAKCKKNISRFKIFTLIRILIV